MSPARTRRQEPAPIVEWLRPGVFTQAEILAELRRALVAGVAAPGSALPVDAIAERFQVSRIPVREALKSLQAEGLVEHQPRGEYIVTRLTQAEYTELYAMREALESLAMRAAIHRADDEMRSRLATLHTAAGEALAAGDAYAWDRIGRRIHATLIAASGMTLLPKLLDTVFNIAALAQPMGLVTAQELDELHGEHGEMVQAFVTGDADRLISASHRHTTHLQQLVASLPQDLDVFASPPKDESPELA